MKIALFGATGFSGRAVLRTALAEGHVVRALVRDPSRLAVHEGSLEVIQGDALSLDPVRETLKGVDVVVHCLGVGGKGTGQPTTLVSDSVSLVLTAMQELGVSRIVCMSNVGAGGSGTWLANRVVIPLFVRWLRPLIDDKDRMEALLAESPLDWVSVRLPNIVEGPEAPVQTSADGRGLSLSITTGSVARVLLDQATTGPVDGPTPSVSN